MAVRQQSRPRADAQQWIRDVVWRPTSWRDYGVDNTQLYDSLYLLSVCGTLHLNWYKPVRNFAARIIRSAVGESVFKVGNPFSFSLPVSMTYWPLRRTKNKIVNLVHCKWYLLKEYGRLGLEPMMFRMTQTRCRRSNPLSYELTQCLTQRGAIL